VSGRDVSPDPWTRLRSLTAARIGLERCGDAISTRDLLKFQLDHAHARDAVKGSVDFLSLADRIGHHHVVLRVNSAAADRATFIRRPDLGRRLDAPSIALLSAARSSARADVLFVIADGLSADAVQDHAVPVLHGCLDRLHEWRIAPIVLAAQARVALGDEICMHLNADLCVVLIGERPGLSVANSLGIYLTWRPRLGHRDADRNCISNIHSKGLGYDKAAETLVWLLTHARQHQVSGISLKENASASIASMEPSGTARLLNPRIKN
jgi:ethanolamine ammonia-lyase small subunit